ncbi:MAG: AMP-binding protein [Phycisphaerae bacterium]|nr:MAG: phenylacetate--CoA ligase family protein [Planctomycetota bacterium]MBE7457853.1 phenylacetate--CoA ligase family protein [Planctomycetia bacterium]MCK6465750.1 AMP-binding protein [Phycisphaerae bacterium]MCL4719084.1 AMP-binding protein [Phycisphaerae bacterium]MCQ3921482.1 phenylacetate--CoA ligase family protein [Planctomycetota bacterium]
MTSVPYLLSRHILCPLHERVLGRRTFARLRQIEREQWRSPVEVRLLQMRRLRSLLRHAVRNVPFYTARHKPTSRAERDGEPDRLHLRALPTLSKQDIRAHTDELIWPESPGRLRPYSTGGSSGDPLRFFIDRPRQASDAAARILTHRWFGVDAGHRELFLWGCPIELTRTDRLRAWRDGLFNHRLLSAFDLSRERMREYTDVFRRFRPRCLFGYPSTLSRWAEHLMTYEETLPIGCLRAVFVTGEVCDPVQRRTLERCFQVPVADGYGSREAGFIAHQCPAGSMHVIASEVLVEVLDGDRPAREGEFGEIVVTHLHAFGMPFIRYRTGDFGRLLPGRCPCGRGWPRMDAVQGRRTDGIHLPDGRFMHGLAVIYVLRETPGIEHFQVRQTSDFALEVQVVACEGAPSDVLRRVESGLRRVVGDQIPVRVRRTATIERAASGKHRPVISDVDASAASSSSGASRTPRSAVAVGSDAALEEAIA